VKVPKKTICVWKQDVDHVEGESWKTDCGNRYVFISDGPAENGMVYCCYCGHSLIAKPTTPEEP
jgi:hypothetical protein